jgi:class 3 adenylate cyclase
VKWTLAVLGVAVVPLVAVAFFVLRIQREGLRRAEQQLEVVVVDEAAQSVVAALDELSDVAARVNVVFADEAVDADARTRMIADIVARAPDVAGVSFFDDERRFVDAVVRPERGGAAAREALRVAPVDAGHRVVARAPRYEARLTGGVRGWIVVALTPDVLDRRMRDVSLVRFGAPDRVALVDESLAVLGGGARQAPGVLSALPTRSFASELVVTTEQGDGPRATVGTIRTMPKQRWALVVERPAAEAFEALTEARRTFLAGIAGIALAVVAASALVVGRVASHVRALVDLVGRYGRREFAARSDVKTGDELEELGGSLERMADALAASDREIEKRARVEANLRRYMPAEAAEAAAKESATLDLGGAKRRVTIVFADVVGFTSFAERSSPETSVAFLNELFTMLSEIVFRNGGIVDKFLGDCVMAVFRPSADGATDDVARALAAAEDMHAFVASNLPRWREAYAFSVELGIGVSTGEVLVGNLGSEARMEYTVIGDAVNVAARLEALAKPRQTLTTRDVVAACPGLSFASLGEHALRGKAKPVEIFEVLG